MHPVVAIAASVITLTTYPSGTYTDATHHDTAVVNPTAGTIKLQHLSNAPVTVSYADDCNGVIEFTAGGLNYLAGMRTDGSLVVASLDSSKAPWSGTYANPAHTGINTPQPHGQGCYPDGS